LRKGLRKQLVGRADEVMTMRAFVLEALKAKCLMSGRTIS
jgi:hypothetical protein